MTSASYDAVNRLTNWDSETLAYDDNGNLLSAGSSTYSWNARDELVATSAGSGTFAYDAFGRRTSRTIGGSTATYLHDGLNPVVADGEFWLNGLGLDERYARIAGTAVTSVLTDALGSTVALSDGAGATTASFAYEPYGAATKTGTADTAFRFTGRADDGATGLQYFRSRYYSAELGRFISSDPIGLAGGANTYAYVNGDPAGANDPLGLAFTSVDWACAKDPMFCAEIMGQMVRSNAAVRGDPCAIEAADALSGAMMTMANVAVVAAVVSVVPRAARLPFNLKSSRFGLKIADEIPASGVPRNWSRGDILDAIDAYRTSIASRKAELAAFDAVGSGHAGLRLAHARRITQEEEFLSSLIKALER